MAGQIDVKEAARETFRGLARQAGLDAARFEMTRTWVKDDARRLHIVARFDGPEGSVMLKQAFRPEDDTEFSGIVAAHRVAAEAVRDVPGVDVPQVVAVDSEKRAFLMSHLPGETLLDLCRATEDHAPLLEATGRWLSAYHAGTFEEERVFQPKFMAQHMLRLVDQMERGERKIRGQKAFIEYARQVQALVPDCSDQISKIAAKHGDLNAHNILIGEGSVGAYDFLPTGPTPVGYDIARILVSYMQMVGDISKLERGEVVSSPARAAFFEGYTFVPESDPGVRFLQRIQLLSDWNRMHHGLSPRSIIRFKRLRAMAKRAFG
ncbi:phosphotransferase [Pseudaestuariivita sp.]|uniref:phosphotransferase n=1 Tax=Pseudaestuariivita sp. TaxID=2211669 RepID=UPI004058B0DE